MSRWAAEGCKRVLIPPTQRVGVRHLQIRFTKLREGVSDCRERRPWRSAFARNRGTAQRPFPTDQTDSLQSVTPTRPTQREPIFPVCNNAGDSWWHRRPACAVNRALHFHRRDAGATNPCDGSSLYGGTPLWWNRRLACVFALSPSCDCVAQVQEPGPPCQAVDHQLLVRHDSASFLLCSSLSLCPKLFRPSMTSALVRGFGRA